MPLIDLQTNLRDLKFGNDRVAGDSSKQPFIQTTLPGIDKSLQTFISLSAEGIGASIANAFTADVTPVSIDLQLPVAGTGGTDFILRGGNLLPNRIEKDVKRLFKFFASPNGILFIAKQNILSRLSVKTQASGIFVNDGVYTPLSTLTSAAGTALGISVNKQSPALQNIPTLFKNPTRGRYESEVYERDNNENGKWEKSSRLFQLQNCIITNASHRLGGIGPENFKIGGIKLNPDSKLFEKFKGNVLLKYGGGPDTFLGTIGNTNIRFASERTSDALSALDHLVLNATEISTASNTNTDIVKQRSNPAIMDFRRPLKSDYSTKNIEDRLNLGSPGKPKTIIGRIDNRVNVHSRHDKINALPIYQSENVKNESSFPTTDIIPFRIGVINNDNPTLKTYIHFRAFLDNISDSYKADWKKQNYIGRGEDFFTYSGFDRTVSLGWTVVAQSKEELIPMYKKLNYLASIVMPDYSPAGYMRGNMVTLTVGGYFNEQPGIITGFSFDMNDDSATWEIGIYESGDEDPTTSQLPHLIKVKGFNFIPIHNFVPRLQQNDFGVYNNQNKTFEKKDNGDISVEYGKEHFIALTPTNNSFIPNLYTIDNLLTDDMIEELTPPPPENPLLPALRDFPLA